MIRIRRIAIGDADRLRDVRLRALSDSPMAFGSTYARELAFEPAEWQRRCQRLSAGDDAITFLAMDDDRCVGIIGCLRERDDFSIGTIVSMWVAPESRRRGLGGQLVRTVEAWAATAGCASLLIDVVENNAAAIELYRRCGFEFTGESQPYPNDPALRERFMLKLLRGAVL